MNEEAYIRLTAPITPQSTQRLLQVIDQKYQAGVRKLHLLLSTPGGSVAHGIAIYNFLKGIPMDVICHNFGTVDSIGVIIFCAAEHRYSVPNARFFLHPVGMDIDRLTRVDEHWLSEQNQSLTIDQENIAKIIGLTAGKDYRAVLKDIGDRKSLAPEEAKEYGLVQKIKPELMPLEADFVPIYESEAQPPPYAGQQIQVSIPQGIVAAPPPDSSTSVSAYLLPTKTKAY